jgi:outer membrane protein assembly factor BamB
MRRAWLGSWQVVVSVAAIAIDVQGCGSGDSTSTSLDDGGGDATVDSADGGSIRETGSFGDTGSVGESGGTGDASPSDGARRESAATDAGTQEAAADGGTKDTGGDSRVDASADSSVDASMDSAVDAGKAPVFVLEHHNHPSRDGVYVDAKLTKAALGTMHIDSGFSATTTGATYAQPLFMSNGPQGKDTVFVVTENDDVFALDATSGMQLWMKNVGANVSSGLPCGSISPLGITGTPVIDLGSRRLFFDAMIQGPGGVPRHNAFALSVDDGSIQWQTDLTAAISGFDSVVQNQRGALTIAGGKVFIPFGGLDGDCANYKGWVIGVPIASGQGATAWVTAAFSGPGIWGPSGVASDGTSIFVATGNTNDRSPGNPRPTVWQNANSEAIIKLTTAPAFVFQPGNYWAPIDWLTQDTNDSDIASSGVVLFDAPGATPSTLAFAMGKTAIGHIADRTALGGVGDGLSTIAGGAVFGAMFAYTTTQGTYVGAQTAFSGCSGGDFSVAKVSATNPPALSFAWCASEGGTAGPIVSQTVSGGSGDNLVWGFGADGDGILRAFDADIGMRLFSSSAVANHVQHWTSPIVAQGRIYVAGDRAVYAFAL